MLAQVHVKSEKSNSSYKSNQRNPYLKSAKFKWYQDDFGALYLNDVCYKEYEIIVKEYNWHI